MKKSVFLLLFLFIISLSAIGNNIIVENPPFSIRNSKTVEIDKIEISDSSTAIHITAYSKPKTWIRIDSVTYIRANGNKYLITSSPDIELNKEVYLDETGQMSFVLYFPSIDKRTQTLDFIESDCESCFKIWGIELHEGELKNRIEVPQNIKDALLIEDVRESLPEPKLESGEAILSGRVLGYVPEMKTFIDVYVNNPILGQQERFYAKLTEDGSFLVKVPLICTMEVQVAFGNLYRRSLLLTPKEESVLFLDLQEKSRTESRNRNNKNKKEGQPFVYNAGTNAYINNWLANNSLSEMSGGFNHGTFISDIKNMESSLEYKNYLLSEKDILLFEISKLNVSGSLKEFLSMKAILENGYYLFMGYYYLPTAYRKKYKDNENYEAECILGTFDEEYYSFIKDMQLDNPKLLYVSNYSDIIEYCRTFRPTTDSLYLRVTTSSNTLYIIDSLLSMVDMPEEDIKYANYLKKESYENWSSKQKEMFKLSYEEYVDDLLATNDLNKIDLRFASKLKQMLSSSDLDIEKIRNIGANLIYNIRRSKYYSDSIKKITMVYPSPMEPDPDLLQVGKNWHEKYREHLFFIKKKKEKEEKSAMLSKILGFDSGLFYDFLTAQYYTDNIEEQTPLILDELNYIKKQVSPFLYNYINDKNTELERALLMAKNNKGYTIYGTPEVEDDILFQEIVKPFKGKVVFVDFWATWCGPCRSAMKEFEGTKKEFKSKDVVFIYITDETSPLKTWDNMIVTIDGEHYRITNSQLEYLKRKFKFTGVPSYLIIGKDGQQVYSRTGFEGTEKLSKIISDELNK